MLLLLLVEKKNYDNEELIVLIANLYHSVKCFYFIILFFQYSLNSIIHNMFDYYRVKMFTDHYKLQQENYIII